MKSVIVKKIKTLTLILLIIFAVLSVNLFLPGCNKNLINDDGSSNEKTATSKNISQQYTNIDSQITKTPEDKTDGKTNKTTKYEALGFETKDYETVKSKTLEPESKKSEVTAEPKTIDEILFSFTVCGDNRPADDYLTQPEVFLKLLGLIKNENTAFHMTTGDIINGGTDNPEIIQRQFSDYLDAVKILPVINFISPGNHDIANNISRKYFLEMINKKTFRDSINNGIQIFTADNMGNIISLNSIFEDEKDANNFYYYFEFKGINFLVLNAFEKGYWGAVKANQLEWLEKVLENLKSEEVFIFIHTPVYSVLNPDTITDGSKHVAFSSKKNLDYIKELFKKYNVDGVFSGHEHMYNKQFHDGTTFIITALSGEYPFVPEEEGGFQHFCKIDVMQNNWILNVIDSNGNLKYQEEITFN